MDSRKQLGNSFLCLLLVKTRHREPSHLVRIWIKDRACVVFCGGHFEFLIRAWSDAMSGTEN